MHIIKIITFMLFEHVVERAKISFRFGQIGKWKVGK